MHARRVVFQDVLPRVSMHVLIEVQLRIRNHEHQQSFLTARQVDT